MANEHENENESVIDKTIDKHDFMFVSPNLNKKETKVNWIFTTPVGKEECPFGQFNLELFFDEDLTLFEMEHRDDKTTLTINFNTDLMAQDNYITL